MRRRSEAENRYLKRVNVSHNKQYSVKLYVRGKTISAQLIDYNATGIKVKLPDKSAEISKIDRIEVFYGKSLLSDFTNPKIVRNKDGEIGIALYKEKEISDPINRKTRVKIREDFRPYILVRDPYKPTSNLHFVVEDVSAGGMLARSSLSNHHILPLSKLEKAQVFLPAIGISSCDFIVKHVVAKDGFIYFGLQSINEEKTYHEKLSRFALSATKDSGTIIDNLMENKELAGLTFKKLGSAVRIDYVSTASEFEEVLKLRYLAYKEANKIDKLATADDMYDEYDLRSVILCAKINGKVVGTVRLTFSPASEEAFPFESYYADVEGVDKKRRGAVEICRLAIDPKFQGTDIVLALFQAVGRELVSYVDDAYVLSTRSLSRLYKSLGFKSISEEVDHPYLENDPMSLYWIPVKHFEMSKGVRAMTWDLIVHDVIADLSYFGIVGKPKHKLKYAILKVIEDGYLKLKKKKKK